MGEEVAVAHTNAEVQAVYQKAQQFDQARDWNIPSYAWDVAHIKQLQQMSLDSIINHLRQLIAAKLGMEDLQRQLEQQTRSETDHFNSALAEQKKQLKRYVYLNQHPHEAAYFKEHPNGYPREQKIDYHNTRTAFWGTFIAWGLCVGAGLSVNYAPNVLISVVLVLFSLLSAVMIPIFVVLYLMAKFGFHFSQPWSNYHNWRIRKVRTDILKADEEYRRANNRNDEALLEKEFKYPDAITAYRGEYVEAMQETLVKTNAQLQQYIVTVNAHVGFFPPDDTQNMQHLFRVYLQFWNGRAADWQTATTLVDQSEQMNDLKESLIAEIHSATTAVIDSINQARDQITNAIEDAVDAINEVADEVNHMTNAINYWGRVQTELSAVQTGLLAQADARIGAYRRY
ncbi:hypothetical protein [Lacticaseibacillus hegangensis]|uniref:Uncharacterized protein n=1 Tax=Lacticaseibacillus hegangensis TaxID=2486010 RepID=A0ABW4CTM1_9LACO|nr:hypothetical protein [Lacticaseibacillus hegangensis]